jgi:hypothetical protein
MRTTMLFGLRTKAKRFQRHQHLRRIVDYSRLTDKHRICMRYIGWLGHRNVGDEALYFAFRDTLFKDALVVPLDDWSPLAALATLRERQLVVLGGGTLINVDPYLFSLERTQELGMSSIVFGTGVADLEYWSAHRDSGRGNAERWIKALSRAKYVGVRGPRSQKWLQEQGIADVELVGDPALSIVPPMAAKRARERPTLAVNLGAHDPVQGGEAGTFEAMTALVQHALREDMAVKYVALHDIDLELGEKLKRCIAHERFHVAPFEADAHAVMTEISACDLLVGQRLHATVLACALSVPNLSLSYQPKCLDFLESIDRADLAVPTEGITATRLIERFEWLKQNAAGMQFEIRTACDSLREKQRSRAASLIERFS